MNGSDWSIDGFYFIGMIGMAMLPGHTQRIGRDYFLGI